MISIITPSVRKKALDIVAKSIQKQTTEDWEWLIGSKFDPKIPWAKWVKDDFEGGFWTLNRIYNKLVHEAQGDIIVSWQDSIYIPPEGLESFQTSFWGIDGLGLISGVGDQYEHVDAFGKPYSKVWTDPRKTVHYGTFYECTFPDVEWNWCAVPKLALTSCGGFDNGLDFLGFGMDGYQVNERLNEMGWKFYIDQTNESYTLRHDRSSHGGEDNWVKNNNLKNGNYEIRRQELKDKDQWPVLKHFGVDL
jgi:hypothetical protein